ncbi:hypothetical protein RJ640_022715 [Escallonia rubra]|uniref:Uncharacterized protein n=1 Tax=Escallonia rubra TaxID=112253 RepID=A0AA88QSH2_9ASTE|nr:hypothetical protein RJ640_022715 [Escallonia rubra]
MKLQNFMYTITSLTKGCEEYIYIEDIQVKMLKYMMQSIPEGYLSQTSMLRHHPSQIAGIPIAAISLVWAAWLRFSEVAKLKAVLWLDIRSRVETEMLSTGPTRSYGLQTAKAAIRLINQREDVPFNEADTVCLDFQSSAHERRQQNEQISRERRDWWMEIKMGEFMNEQGDDGKVEARLIETHGGKSDLIVEGTEFRLNKEPI